MDESMLPLGIDEPPESWPRGMGEAARAAARVFHAAFRLKKGSRLWPSARAVEAARGRPKAFV
jgi:hypothetical protein